MSADDLDRAIGEQNLLADQRDASGCVKRFDVELDFVYGGGGAGPRDRDPALRFDEHPLGKYELHADAQASRDADRAQIDRLKRIETAAQAIVGVCEILSIGGLAWVPVSNEKYAALKAALGVTP